MDWSGDGIVSNPAPNSKLQIANTKSTMSPTDKIKFIALEGPINLQEGVSENHFFLLK
jgi:hypothetical protein